MKTHSTALAFYIYNSISTSFCPCPHCRRYQRPIERVTSSPRRLIADEERVLAVQRLTPKNRRFFEILIKL